MRFENDWFEEEFDGSFHLSLSLLIAHKHWKIDWVISQESSLSYIA